MQDRSDTIRDQVGCFEVDFIDLFFRELALAGVDVLQRHQEDHAGPGFFICAIEKRKSNTIVNNIPKIKQKCILSYA